MAVWRCLRHLGKGVEHQHCPRRALVCAGPFDRLVWWPTVLAIFLATCIAGFFSAYGRIPAVVSLIHHQLHDLSNRLANLLTTLEIEQGNREGGLSPKCQHWSRCSWGSGRWFNKADSVRSWCYSAHSFLLKRLKARRLTLTKHTFGLTIGVDEQFVNAYQVGSWRCEYSHALSNQIVLSSEGILLAALPLYKTDMKSQIGRALPELVAYPPKSGFHG